MKNTTSKSLRLSVSALSIVALLMIFPACSAVRDSTISSSAFVSDRMQTDSIFVHDSVYVRIRADTVYLERWHTRWRDRETVRRDTVTQYATRTETVQVRYIPRFYKWCAVVASVVVAVLLLFIAFRIYRRFR